MDSNILIVDDEKPLLETLLLLFKREGYKTAVASEGPSAVEMVKKQHFNLAMVDIRIPGMDGVEILHQVKQISPATTVIMMTAYPDKALEEKVLNDGAYAVIHKPFNVSKTMEIIKQAETDRRVMLLIEELEKTGHPIGKAKSVNEIINSLRTDIDFIDLRALPEQERKKLLSRLTETPTPQPEPGKPAPAQMSEVQPRRMSPSPQPSPLTPSSTPPPLRGRKKVGGEGMGEGKMAVSEPKPHTEGGEKEQGVLLVEDDPTQRDLLGVILKRAGYNIITAEDGARAIEQASKAAPAVAIIDFGLPDMDGFQLAAKLKKIKSQTLVILLTGRMGMEEEADELAKKNVYKYLVKPVDPGELKNCLKTILNPEDASATDNTENHGEKKQRAEGRER